MPFFLTHHRKLGVGHFLFVDNGSDDGTADYLRDQDDVSVWTTQHSYRLSRFGVDWLAWLQIKYGHGKWCLTLDADEIFIYPYYQTRSLHALVSWLEAENEVSFGALMLEMYPKGPISRSNVAPWANPIKELTWFDSGNYTIRRQSKLHNLWIQGGVRARCFFQDEPRKAPTLSKTPLVKWNRRFAYVSSTHTLLPRRLNEVYAEDGGEKISGILLHTKFLPSTVQKSSEDLERKQHFENSHLYEAYYKSLINDPNLWCVESQKFTGWRQLEKCGLMSRGGWI